MGAQAQEVPAAREERQVQEAMRRNNNDDGKEFKEGSKEKLSW